ncbi:aminopeptidase [Candidatus Palauibacter sp.]|uniref:aminopeptidase n=1 Tax=Candidatus Palauibacter sp. TaxID=3101350 RepID=UPI003B0109A7
MRLTAGTRALLALLLLGASGCSPAYVLRAGWEEARILSARRPIRAVIHDTTVAVETRDKLRLVLDARDFAERDLGLRAGASYESFAQLHRDTLLLNVLAAPEFELRWKTWWFPIVGHLPYKGYFDFDDARAEAASLAAEGYDVSVRPVSAFSTLGWFPDPIMSTTLRLDSLGLVETVIHEITHSTYFPTGQADFNESFANFVGHRGAIEFFCDAVRDESACQRALWRWEDTRVFGHFFHSILAPLEEVYASTLPDDEKRAAKREVFVAAAQRFETEYKPRLHARYGSIDPDGLDNAWVISRLLYYTRLDDFERVYQSRGSLVPSVEALMEEATTGDPWDALTRLTDGSREDPG